ncbi:hypothetical protein [Brevundimonas sp. A19_0]|uniref:hypothetical protein n=1 Tax=Brevundimonas sp. A19_0 TaxID=2821087 RepID=UPI001ADCA25E|nr:hypothetical protein [Brevundimonas sp. A19_0]MBO9500788.1 hypothetical protein [Brevundimonas sp. A19_0]
MKADLTIRLSTDHEIDALELAWARERNAERYYDVANARASGRSVKDWKAAQRAAKAPAPLACVMRERRDLVAQCLTIGFTIEAMARICRAPRSWCLSAAREIFEQGLAA